MKRRQLAAAGDLGQRGELGAGIGRDEELDRVDPVRAPALLGQLGDRGAEARGVELERRQLARHRRVEPLGGRDAQQRAARSACSRYASPAAFAAAASASSSRLAALDRVELGAQLAHLVGQLVDLAAVLAGDRAQLEQPGLGAVERERDRAPALRPLRPACPRPRPPRSPRGRAPRALRRAADARRRSGRAAAPRRAIAASGESDPSQTCRSSSRSPASRSPFCMPRARFGEARLLARLRLERGQFGEVRQQQVLVGLRALDLRARGSEPVLGRAPRGPGRRHARRVAAGEPVEQQRGGRAD